MHSIDMKIDSNTFYLFSDNFLDGFSYNFLKINWYLGVIHCKHFHERHMEFLRDMEKVENLLSNCLHLQTCYLHQVVAIFSAVIQVIHPLS